MKLIKKILNKNKYIKDILLTFTFVAVILYAENITNKIMIDSINRMVEPQLKTVLIHTKEIFIKHQTTLDYITDRFEAMDIGKLSELERDIVCTDITQEIIKRKDVHKLLTELVNFKIVSEMDSIYILTRINKKYYFIITDSMAEIRGFNIGKPLLIKNYSIFNKAFTKGIFNSGIVTDELGQHYSAVWSIKKGYLAGVDYGLDNGFYGVLSQFRLYAFILLIICILSFWFIKLNG